ncbi:MAG: hypothetical protein EBY13_04820 [Actinobacteria bacterium]|jgi:hypothetical protein|nr:hypothetical protein [Actinomycetota bacterium]
MLISFARAVQEDGTLAGDSLNAIQIFLYFFVAPTGMFLLISALSWASSGKKKSSKQTDSSLTRIE